MEGIKLLLKRNKNFISFAVYGLLTTLVNMITYYICYNIIGILNVPSTIVAWLLAVIFAFITNKLWVFYSRSFDRKTLSHEIPFFFGARIATGILDVAIMYLAVDLFIWNSTIWKLISNVIVIILNYVASKLVVFNVSGQ